jgi:hypothetical protein
MTPSLEEVFQSGICREPFPHQATPNMRWSSHPAEKGE